VIFLLSAGADPTDNIEQLAKKKKQSVQCVSLGQGQVRQLSGVVQCRVVQCRIVLPWCVTASLADMVVCVVVFAGACGDEGDQRGGGERHVGAAAELRARPAADGPDGGRAAGHARDCEPGVPPLHHVRCRRRCVLSCVSMCLLLVVLLLLLLFLLLLLSYLVMFL
jgi:hypothetical protein